jgi:hypothetical protein
LSAGSRCEAAVDGAGSESAEPKIIVGNHAGRSAESRCAAGSAIRAETAAWTTGSAARPAIHQALTPAFVITGLSQATAGAAIDEKCFLGISACESGVRDSSQGIGCRGCRALTFGSGPNFGVLESAARTTAWTARATASGTTVGSAVTGIRALRTIPEVRPVTASAATATSSAWGCRRWGSPGCGFRIRGDLGIAFGVDLFA